MSSDSEGPRVDQGDGPGPVRKIAVAVGNAGHVRQGVGEDFGAERAGQGVRVDSGRRPGSAGVGEELLA